MKIKWILKVCFLLLSIIVQGQTRDPYFWPFEKTSIWNTPIGDGAKYVYAGIQPATDRGLTVDEDYIHMFPQAPLTPILSSSAGWSSTKSRCDADGGLFHQVPLKKNWEISRSNWDGNTPNAGLAVLMPDGRTIKQNQPFARCVKGQNATTKYTFEDVDLFGEGILGAHGGSRMSAIGGAIRVGELVPGGEIKHALKINLFGKKNYYYGSRKGHRWPAPVADGYAASNYNGLVEACTMGSLLAIPHSINLDSLSFETEPARILARAMQSYGAYIVDDTGWNVYALITEWSPTGRVKNEFESVWGFTMKQEKFDNPWIRDIFKIMKNLYVVDNNSPSSIGGGGNPLAPNAPEFGRAGNIVPKISLTKTVSEVFVTEGTSIPLAVNALDVDGSISEVQYFVDNKMVGRATSKPYEINWVADKVGSFLFVAKAIDNEYGVAVSHGLKINVDPSLTKKVPVISLLGSNGSDLVNDGQSIDLSINQSLESIDIYKVDYYEGFHFIGSANKAPFKISADFIDAGTHNYVAKAYGKNGTIGYSEGIVVESLRKNDPPTCIITTPTDNYIITDNQNILLTVEAFDIDSEIQKVELYMNNDLIMTRSTPPYKYTIQRPKAGNHIIYAKVFDVENDSSLSTALNVTVNQITGIHQLEESGSKFSVSPNPFKNGDLTISIESEEAHSVKIITLNGRILYHNNKVVGKCEIPYDSIGFRGVCIVKVINLSGSYSRKIIVI